MSEREIELLEAGDADLTARGHEVRAAGDAGRPENEAQRLDRNLSELVQELRVAGLGVQVLFGFLLSMPFTNRFAALDDSQRNLYVADLLLSALATALLSGPVAYHRIVFRKHQKGRLVRVANIMAIAGLTTVGLAISGAVALVVSLVYHGVAVPLIAALTVAMFGGLWYVVPLMDRGQDDY